MTRLFDRTWRVTMVGQQIKEFGGRLLIEESTNATVIEGNRVRFEVKKNLGREPNSCALTIDNLAKNERAMAASSPLYVVLHAGYDGVQRMLFTGNALPGTGVSIKAGTAWETKIQVGDGAAVYANAHHSRSYKPPVTVAQVLKDAAATMGMEIPPEVARSPELQQAVASGIALHSPTRDVLTRMLAPYGYAWSIQDGRLLIHRDDDHLEPNTAVLIRGPSDSDDGTGLIGSPERSAPNRSSGRVEVTFATQLYPELTPGKLVKIESDTVDGTFRLTDVNHLGDSHGNDWKTMCKGIPR